MRSMYDAAILGSGFAGSLLGWLLAKQGWRVLIIDPQHHPRFAIGESSTPTADFLIAYLASRWNLPELQPLATYGSWKQHYPHLACGKKRGFSYYHHLPNGAYQDDDAHSRSLLVAASSRDAWSDTHWHRSSVDHFLAQQAVASGVSLREGAMVTGAIYDRVERLWTLLIRTGDPGRDERATPANARWLIDASGGGGATAAFVDNPRDDRWMRTRTRATFAHFQDVQPFAEQAGPDDPFAGDDAAQHHVFEDGWCWMLRMDNGITSVGVVKSEVNESTHGSDLDKGHSGRVASVGPIDDLCEQVQRYPSVVAMLAGARHVAPAAGLVQTGRISRCRGRAQGEGWVLLPAAFGIVDPLHSTGIAHSLSGVARVADALLGPPQLLRGRMEQYEKDLRQEIRWIDTLVAGCYRALPSFSRFVTFANFYFAAAVQFEAAMAADPTHWPQGFLHCNDLRFQQTLEDCFQLLEDRRCSDDSYRQFVRAAMSPWNPVGLLDPAKRNRLAHTSAPKHLCTATLHPVSP